jgi:hypothetical protein
MSQSGDVWYVRFPDGHIVRAASTAILRKQLDKGRIPTSSTVRRSPEDEWVTLEWTEEFADLVKKRVAAENGAKSPPRRKKRRAVQTGKPITAGGRLDPKRLQLLGMRGVLREMLGALDATVMPKKLTAAFVAACGLGAVAGLSRLPWPDLGMFQVAILWVLGACALVVLALLSGVLTRMTYIELAQLRPARVREGMRGLGRRAFRLLLTWTLAMGGVVALLGLLRWATAWLAIGDLPLPVLLRDIVANLLMIASVVLEFVLGPLFGLALLLGPILAVEECSVVRAFSLWRSLLRQHCRRVMAYEVAAFAIAAGLTLPFALPLLLGAGFATDYGFTAPIARAALWGFLAALPAAYLIVANVFIYLNVRYETIDAEQLAAGS